MTENQTPGPVPEDNRAQSRNPWDRQGAEQPGDRQTETQYGNAGGPGTPQGNTGAQDHTGPQTQAGPQNNTERLDPPQARDHHTQELPGAPRPVYPQRQPFYGQSANYGQQHQDGQSGYYGQQQYQNGQPTHGTGHGAPNGSVGLAPNPKDAPRRKATFGIGTLVASILAAGLVGGGVATVGAGELSGHNASSTSTVGSNSQPGTVIVNNKDDVNAITAAAVKASPSVVTISATSGSSGGTGSGIVIDDQGHILTNTHVVTLDGQTANATLEIRTSDGKVLPAKLVGTDPLSDLAVIKVDDTSGLTPATLGDSSKLNVGDTAIAIGSPLGLTGTVTDGIVSTLNRTISVASSAAPKGGDNSQGGDQGFQFAPPGGGQSQQNSSEGSIAINVIQTDAAINPGNSGGALVNSKGEIIGVNVAIASAGSGTSTSQSGNIGVGFSIPINNAKRVAQEIIDSGKASHGQLGVSVKAKTTSGAASEFSVGADVATVEANSAAGKAGIKAGDVITKFNDLTIGEPNQLTAAVREQPAGSKVKITVQRGGSEQTFDVTLGAAAS
ncbi:trypsin-like peptidase domain-containing protein [Arthrobacter sp. FW306-05-C]|uniref:S1C family serine protease n=1 Tax=unclassified Arthrobacter TaxID=235627 RepID=UPI001EF12CBA|nr:MULTISPECIES: trypsin-like peptidase domain-containing protein [unclassified Arthrobacter]UKA65504.1 trypsin-like peptidase domain-containing protein [Arthrobacter sp. FW306-05-C]UKA74170.1 trypsin-like peptidase domain-containing protein [Arthrobacter sp. FW306-07-I]